MREEELKMSDLEVYRAAIGFVRVIQEALSDPKALESAAQNISRLSKQEEDKLKESRDIIASAQSIKAAQDANDAALKSKLSDLSDQQQKIQSATDNLQAQKEAFAKDAASKKQELDNLLQDLQNKKSDFETDKNSILSLSAKLQDRENGVSQREDDVAKKEEFLKSEEERIKSYEDQIKAKAQKLKELAEG